MAVTKTPPSEFFARPAAVVARELIGCSLLLTRNGETVGGIITETEAYTSIDPASHSFRGPTQANKAMYGPPGTLYVYLIYGLHHCLNIVSGGHDGQAVLLRALQPTDGVESMLQRRRTLNFKNIASGPAKLVQALGIGPEVNGLTLADAGISITLPAVIPTVVAGPRVGISKAVETPWNFQLSQLIQSSYAKS